jgi:hypothetical protein
MAPNHREEYPVELNIADLMDAPDGMLQVGDEFRVIDHDVAPDPPDEIGECERCGKIIRERVIGHICEDEFRDHPEGEGIRFYDE